MNPLTVMKRAILIIYLCGLVTGRKTEHLTTHGKTWVDSGQIPDKDETANDAAAKEITANQEIQIMATIEGLQKQVEKLLEWREKDRYIIQDQEKKMQGFQEDSLQAIADAVQLQQRVTETQQRLQVVEEKSQEQGLDISRLDFDQKQMKRDVSKCKDFKEKSRKNIREVQRSLSKVIVEKDELAVKVVRVSDKLQDMRTSQVKNENLTDAVSKKLDNYIKSVKISKQSMDRKNVTQKKEFKSANVRLGSYILTNELPDATRDVGSGEIEPEYILSNIDKSSNQVEFGSGEDEGSGQIEDKQEKIIKSEYFKDEIHKRDVEIVKLRDLYTSLSTKFATVEDRLMSIQLGDFMQRLQQSLLNFTQNVITLDQWKMSSSEIVNFTQQNNHQITQLMTLILNNTNKIHDMEFKMVNVQVMGDQQFNILRRHVIKLNNTVQDMKEEMNYQNRHELHMQHVPVYTHSTKADPNLERVTSRIDDLALQIIHNNNRIAHLEIKVLNESLFQCQKYNTDAHQDSRIRHIRADVLKNRETGVYLKELISRLDHGLYRVYLKSRNNSDILARMGVQVELARRFIPVIQDLQYEVLHFKYQLPIDCHEYYQRGYKASDVYIIHPYNATKSIPVYCDMASDGGWTVIQKRYDGSLNFSRAWEDYGEGFGNPHQEYWLGNEYIHLITSAGNYSIKLEMVDIMDGYWEAVYDIFSVASAENLYTLTVDGYQGNSTDSFSYSNSMAFSTPDRDNDASSAHCALYEMTGWWYKHCHIGNLNGRYKLEMIWYNHEWNDWIELKGTVMKVKPNS